MFVVIVVVVVVVVVVCCYCLLLLFVVVVCCCCLLLVVTIELSKYEKKNGPVSVLEADCCWTIIALFLYARYGDTIHLDSVFICYGHYC